MASGHRPAPGERWLVTVRGVSYLTSGAFASAAALALMIPAAAGVLRGRMFSPVAGLLGWERRRVGVVLRSLVPGRHVVPWRALLWLCWQATGGLAIALVAGYLLLGGINALTFPIWWALIGAPPVSPLPGVLVTGWPTAALIPVIGLAYEAALLATAPWAAAGLARLSTSLLGIPRTRARDEQPDPTRGAELRRIERAIHDGVQAHLVNASVLLGMTRTLGPSTPQGAERIDLARGEIAAALSALRGIIDTVYPPVLADRGIEGAVRALAGSCGIPCAVESDELGDVPAEIEAATYFGVAECLSNAVKHARCSQIRVRLRRDPDRLLCEVVDDGVGGAAVARGAGGAGPQASGLAGLAERIDEFAGVLRISSPAGGPTRISWELPCVS
ncbi:ATP-binding protein [Nonomuraea spiralis]|uniref:histidine kinase n=1 Tax=Nonomuraea spiralis TaxID=46182 RepID=A0ABV5IW05_9ACTN|nr:ATP-binding protein [Nonomuraea spiralis]GGS84688.1 hypothetical protein GCM10010176_030510 [Nonomuraea spiralis]